MRMTRKAVVDALELELIDGKAKCLPLPNGVQSFGLGSTLCKMQSDERGIKSEEDGGWNEGGGEDKDRLFG